MLFKHFALQIIMAWSYTCTIEKLNKMLLSNKFMLTFTATQYLPPYTPHVGPLDPVTFKEAVLFTCIRVHKTRKWRNANLFLHPFMPHVGPLDPKNMQRSCASLLSMRFIRPATGFHYQKKLKLLKKNHKKSNIVIFMIYNHM